MGNLQWLDYIILATVGLLVITVFYSYYRTSRKKKVSGCSGSCGACSSSCGAECDSFSGKNKPGVTDGSGRQD